MSTPAQVPASVHPRLCSCTSSVSLHCCGCGCGCAWLWLWLWPWLVAMGATVAVYAVCSLVCSLTCRFHTPTRRHRLFRHCDAEQDGEIELQAFVTGCLSFPLVTQCFDWLVAETAAEREEEHDAAAQLEQETTERAATAQLAEAERARIMQDAQLKAAVAAVGDVTLEMDKATLDAAALGTDQYPGTKTGSTCGSMACACARSRHHR